MAPKAITSKELGPALGMYSHGMVVPAGEIVIVAGQVGTNRAGEVAGSGDVVAQTTQAFENVRAVLTAAGCAMTDVVRFQTFLTHATDVDGFMHARREIFPKYFPGGVYPPNTLLIISRLVKPELLVEIEAMAVKPAKTVSGAGKAPRRAASVSRRARTARRR
jgi:enamine deaminase RidA (YjgF/YER057c/UK114 family)